jgi:hypothetical protein
VAVDERLLEIVSTSCAPDPPVDSSRKNISPTPGVENGSRLVRVKLPDAGAKLSVRTASLSGHL